MQIFWVLSETGSKEAAKTEEKLASAKGDEKGGKGKKGGKQAETKEKVFSLRIYFDSIGIQY